jgi:hypothetical protein
MMTKANLIMAVIVGAVAATPAVAMDMKCDEATMSQMNTQTMGMKDEAMKKDAMNHMAMAKTAMDEKKMDDCMMHMNAAHKAMGNM